MGGRANPYSEVILDFINPVNVFFAGVGPGTPVADFYRFSPKGFCRAFMVEADPARFADLTKSVDLSQPLGDPRFHWLIGLSPSELKARFLRILGEEGAYLSVPATEVVGERFGDATRAAYYKEAMRAYRDAAVEHLLVGGDSSHDAFIGLMNMLRNLDTIARTPGINEFFGKFQGKPCVVVSAGPSLDKNVALLAELQDRAVIICVDAVLKNLIARGISPHFATVLERVNFSAKLFSGLTAEETARTVQLSVPVVMPSVYESWPGPKALLFRPYSHFDWLGLDKGTLLTGASSANMAFKAGQMMGCDPIILMGQDLAFGENCETHASAAPWGTKQTWIAGERRRNIMVKGNVTPLVATTKLWNAFRVHFEKDVAAFEGTVVNATEGGAFIEGTKVMGLREAIDTFAPPPFAPAEVVAKAIKEFGPSEGLAQLERLKAEKVPRTLAALDRVITRLGDLLADFPSPDGGGDLVERALAAYEALGGEILVRQSLYHVVLASINRAVVEHHALGSRVGDSGDLVQARLELHSATLENLRATALKVRELYADLERAKGRDLYAQNLGLLKTSNPALVKLLETPDATPPPSPATGVVGEMGPHTLRVLLGLNFDPEGLAAALAPGKTRLALVLAERDPAVFRRFLSQVDLNAVMLDFYVWFAVGDVAASPLALTDTLPLNLVAAAQAWPCQVKGHAGDEQSEAYYDLFAENLKAQLAVQSRMTTNPKPLLLAESFIANLRAALTFPSTRELKDAARGKPALLLFPGLSEGELAEVRENGKRYVLIASASSLPELLSAGIAPDAVACPSEKDFRALEASGLQLPLAVIAPFSASSTFDYRGSLVLIDHPKAFIDLIARSDAPAFPFVGHGEMTAIGLARNLGCSPIYSLGSAVAEPAPHLKGAYADWRKWCMVTMPRALSSARVSSVSTMSLPPTGNAELERPLWPHPANAPKEAVERTMNEARGLKFPKLFADLRRHLAALAAHWESWGAHPLPPNPGDQWFAKHLLDPVNDPITLHVARSHWYKFLGDYLSVDPSLPEDELERSRRTAYGELLVRTHEDMLAAAALIERACAGDEER